MNQIEIPEPTVRVEELLADLARIYEGIGLGPEAALQAAEADWATFIQASE